MTFILWAAGGLVGHFWFVSRAGKTPGMSRRDAADLGALSILSALFGAHLFSVIRQASSLELAKDLLLHSQPMPTPALGLCGLLGAVLYSIWRRWTWTETLSLWGEAAAVAPFAWMLIRIGCVLEGTHAGIRSDHWLAIPFADHARFDLAMIEGLLMGAVGLAFLALYRTVRIRAVFAPALLACYGLVRLALLPLQVIQESWQTPLWIGITLTGCAGLTALLLYFRRPQSSSMEGIHAHVS